MDRQIFGGQVRELELRDKQVSSPFSSVLPQEFPRALKTPESPGSKPGSDEGKLLPSITLDDKQAYKPPVPYSLSEKIMNVARPIGRGAMTELTENFSRVALSGAVGFGVGYGLAWVPPQYKKYIAAAGLVVAGVQLVRNVPAWYQSARELTDHTTGWNARSQAEKVMEGVGAGGVDLAAGIAGGAMGTYAGNYHIDTLKPVRFDSAGRPIKMPLPDGNGSAYVKYDQSGRVTEVVQRNDSGWRTVLRRDPQRDSQFLGFVDNKFNGLSSDPGRWLGRMTYDKGGVTLIDGHGTLSLRADGPSTLLQTAEQAAKALAVKAEYKAAVKMADQLAERAASGAVGMGMGFRMGRPF